MRITASGNTESFQDARQGLDSGSFIPGIGATSPEWLLILSCARKNLHGPWAARAAYALELQPDWKCVVNTAREHGVLPLLYRHLQSFPAQVPTGVLKQVRHESVSAAGRNLFMTNELLQLIKLLEGADVPVIPLKGPALANRVYQDISLRTYSDLDLLVKQKDVERARRALTQAGYLPEFEETAPENRFIYPTEQVLRFIRTGHHNVVIEMHWHIDPRHLHLAMFNITDLWNRSTSQQFCGTVITGLSDEDLLLYLCIHGAKHCWDKLEWISSVAELLRTAPISWDLAHSLSRAAGGERILHLGLALAKDLTGENGGEALAIGQLHKTSRALAAQVWRMMITSDREYTRTALYRYRFYLKARDRMPDRIRLLLFSLTNLLRPRLLRRRQRTMRLNNMLKNGTPLLPNSPREIAPPRTVQAIEVHGFRGRAHLALIRAMEVVLTRIGRKALIPHTLWLLGKLFGSTSRAQWSIEPGIVLHVSLADRYWMGAALTGEYEPEVVEFLSRLSRRETLFIDCGANIGWWSLIAEKRFGWHCVAVEAAPDVARKLEENRASSNAVFRIVNKAIWNRDGEGLQFLTGTDIHAGGHLKDVVGFLRWRAPKTEEVTTTTVDALVDQALELRSAERIIVKIDVEGAEKQALAGARRTIERGAMIIYEDHGSDDSCEPTRAVMESGMLTYAIVDGLLQPITTVEEARRIKTNFKIGYNFAALLPSSSCMADVHALQAGSPGSAVPRA